MKELTNYLDFRGIPYQGHMIEQLGRYMDGLLEWNEKMNLTAIRDRKAFVEKHYIDSITCVQSEGFEAARSIIDVGTGAGFPGIPLAVLYPEKKFVLMDSLKKRLEVIRTLSLELGIDNVSVVHMRAEDGGQCGEHRERYDMCVSRAVADMSVLSELCLPFVRVGGIFVAYKSVSAADEIKSAEKAIAVLGGSAPIYDFGGTLISGEDSDYDSSGGHILVTVNKERKTPQKYPRKAGTPSRNPIK